MKIHEMQQHVCSWYILYIKENFSVKVPLANLNQSEVFRGTDLAY